jgi:hypothetical protein
MLLFQLDCRISTCGAAWLSSHINLRMHISHKASKIVFFCHPLLGSPNNAVLGSIPPLSLLDFALSPAPSWLLSENGRSTPPPRPREVATINPPQSIFSPFGLFCDGGGSRRACSHEGWDRRPAAAHICLSRRGQAAAGPHLCCGLRRVAAKTKAHADANFGGLGQFRSGTKPPGCFGEIATANL